MKRVFLFVFLITSACADAPTTLPTSSATIAPVTATSAPTPIPTATRTTEQALYPYTIEGLRKHNFGTAPYGQSGKITVKEKTLETEIFTRYAIQYPSDGLTITGVMQIPTIGKPPYPVIVMNHGFFSRTVYASGDGTDRAAEFLNKRGYLTLSSDYRSWADSETGESLFYSGLAIDVVNLMNAIPSVKEADAERIGMWGHSMGGGVTLKVLTINAGRVAKRTETIPHVKAAVLYSSVSSDFGDIIERWGPGCLGDVYQGELAYGCNSSDILPLNLPPDLLAAYFKAVYDPAMLQLVSPRYYLDDVNVPIQIVYGTEDGKTSAGVPPEWSKETYAAFIEADKDANLFAHEGEGHSFFADKWFAFMERSSQFFDKHVKP